MSMKAMDTKLTPKKITPDVKERYTRLFSAKDGSALSFRSGHVVLREGESIGKHNTNDSEEILIILEGNGELYIEKSEKISFEKGAALYVPANMLHDVKNTGQDPLKYVFITSPI